MIEKSKRGGLTFVGAKRYPKANNKHMGELNYGKKQPSTYIAYVDANNLYGWAMVQPLPYKDIKFVDCPPTSGSSRPTSGTIPEPETETLRTRTLNPPTLETVSAETCPETFRTSSSATLRTILETPDDAETGFFCEVDLRIPPRTTCIVEANATVPRNIKTRGRLV